jgi:hypothetical protein
VDTFNLAGLLWLAVFILWAILGLTTKRTVGSHSDALARVSVWFVWLAWLILFNRNFRPGVLGERFFPVGPATNHIGLGLTIAGLGFAVWARFVIGRNGEE